EEQHHGPETEDDLHLAEQMPQAGVRRLEVGQMLEVARAEGMQQRDGEDRRSSNLGGSWCQRGHWLLSIVREMMASTPIRGNSGRPPPWRCARRYPRVGIRCRRFALVGIRRVAADRAGVRCRGGTILGSNRYGATACTLAVRPSSEDRGSVSCWVCGA